MGEQDRGHKNGHTLRPGWALVLVLVLDACSTLIHPTRRLLHSLAAVHILRMGQHLAQACSAGKTLNKEAACLYAVASVSEVAYIINSSAPLQFFANGNIDAVNRLAMLRWHARRR